MYHVKSPPLLQKSGLKKGGTSSATSDFGENLPEMAKKWYFLLENGKKWAKFRLKKGGGLRARQASLSQIALKKGGGLSRGGT